MAPIPTTAAAIAAAAAAAAAAALLLAYRRRRRRSDPPQWWAELLATRERLNVREWSDPHWRSQNGWLGTDYIHGEPAAVHIPGYVLRRGEHPQLIGAVHFSGGAESHKGLCHGGTMCAVMDDVIGWTGFCADGDCQPWSGFTVQINTALKAPVKVGSWLRVEGEVSRREGARKVWVTARLVAPAAAGGDEVVHCTAEGLFVLKKRV